MPATEDTDATREGTAAHECFERLFSLQEVKEGDFASNGVEIDEEMIEGAHLFVDTVRSQVGGDPIYVEQRLEMAKTIHPDNWGTPDVFTAGRDAIRLYDYKYGHAYVDAFENWQCIDYVAGIYEKCRVKPAPTHPVYITIVQPRHYCKEGPVRTWATTIGELMPYWEQLRVAAMRSDIEGVECTVGEYCKYCPCRSLCKSLQHAALQSTDAAYASVPLDIPIEAASRELRSMQRAQALLSARITGLEEMLLQDMRNGGTNPYYMIERAQGRQRWIKNAQEVATLGTLFGIDLSLQKVITPKQAIAKGVPAEVVATVSEAPVGEWKLKLIDIKQSRKAFST